MADTQRITSKGAAEKAEECRQLARQVRDLEHRSMLERMAEAWEEIAAKKHT